MAEAHRPAQDGGAGEMPPRTPIMTNCLVSVSAKMRPSGPVIVAKKPMMKEPTILTMIVPQGNISPMKRAATPEHQ
jgi:hypothetical protein